MLKVGRINFSFAAAHNLPGHLGACRNLHGHNYKLEIELRGHVDPETGMVADFHSIKDLVKWMVIDRLDHTYLNGLDLSVDDIRFPKENPTAENMVLWLSKVLDLNYSTNSRLNRIRLWETDNCYVEWERDG
jgi:6-pyruvoyltetrahydropterin/6-carboxytetrahydropterin synthase